MSRAPLAILDAYLDHLRVERRLAAHTLESYARDLAALAAYAAGAGRAVEALDRPALEQFVRQQMMRGLSPRSVARTVAAIRGFYRFLVLERTLDGSPADDLHPPRAWPALPKFLSIEDVDNLIAQPDVSAPRGLRDRAMIELLYATGLRVTELVSVRLADLHLDEHYLTCIGKGSKERLVPIGEQASEWVRTYQAGGRRHLLKGRSSPRLFLNARGGPLSRVGFWKILKQYGRRAGLQVERDAARAPFTLDVVLEQHAGVADDPRLALRFAAQQRRRVLADGRQAARLEKQDRLAARRGIVQRIGVDLRRRARLGQQTLRDQRPPATAMRCQADADARTPENVGRCHPDVRMIVIRKRVGEEDGGRDG